MTRRTHKLIIMKNGTETLMENTLSPTTRGLSANALKLIAIFAMTIDHIAWAFVPTASPLGQLLHIIGRITAPIMCYFIAVGFTKTRDVKRYLLRLFIFAVISHFPYVLFATGRPQFLHNTSMIFSLFAALLSLVILESKKLAMWLKVILIAACFGVTLFSDWPILAVAWTLCFYIFRNNKQDMITWFTTISAVGAAFMAVTSYINSGLWWRGAFQFGTLLALPLILLYNGERGKLKLRWLFYIYYPLHIALIVLIRYFFFSYR